VIINTKTFLSLFMLGLVLSLVFFSKSIAFQDSDLDGVEDKVDLCPNTPFDLLVDSSGCPVKKDKDTNFYIATGFGYTDGNGYYNYLWNFSIGMIYKKLSLSLSTNYYLYDSVIDKTALGDTYIYASYTFNIKSLYLYPGITLKIPTATDNLGDGEFDYAPSFYADYIYKSLDFFIYYGFVFRGDNQFEDTYTTSLGVGYQLRKLYISGSYDFTGDNNRYVSIFSIYNITSKYYLLLNYSYGLNQESIDQFISLKLGVRL